MFVVARSQIFAASSFDRNELAFVARNRVVRQSLRFLLDGEGPYDRRQRCTLLRRGGNRKGSKPIKEAEMPFDLTILTGGICGQAGYLDLLS
jgi:hypothetical protein